MLVVVLVVVGCGSVGRCRYAQTGPRSSKASKCQVQGADGCWPHSRKLWLSPARMLEQFHCFRRLPTNNETYIPARKRVSHGSIESTVCKYQNHAEPHEPREGREGVKRGKKTRC